MERMRKDRLSGGYADKAPYEKFDKRQKKMGRKTEMEHTNNPKIADEITGDHLMENPRYYDDLEHMEKQYDNKLDARGEVYVPPYYRSDGTAVSGYIRKK